MKRAKRCTPRVTTSCSSGRSTDNSMRRVWLISMTVVGLAASAQAATPAKPDYGDEAKKPGVALAALEAPKKKLGPAELAAFVDAAIQRRLDEKKLTAAPRSDDAEFMRRAALDVAGVIPAA